MYVVYLVVQIYGKMKSFNIFRSYNIIATSYTYVPTYVCNYIYKLAKVIALNDVSSTQIFMNEGNLVFFHILENIHGHKLLK